MKNQVIEALTPEHGAEIIEYWKSRGVDTLGLVGCNCRSHGDAYRYYGVIDGVFDIYSFEDAKRTEAEIIELPETKGYVFHVPTAELSKAVQLRLFDLGYTGMGIIENSELRYIFAENNGLTLWSDKLHEKNEKEYIIGDLNDLFYTDKYRRTKKVVELTMQEIAKKLGVDELIIKE